MTTGSAHAILRRLGGTLYEAKFQTHEKSHQGRFMFDKFKFIRGASRKPSWQRRRRQSMQRGILQKFALLLGLVVLVAFIGGCKKHVAATPPPPPAPPAQPTVTLNATPTAVNPGQAATLAWSSTNATDLDIEPGVGKVAPQGSTPVSPTQSTTYTITATGAGGSATATAHVDVNAPPPPPPAPAPAQPSISELFDQNVKDAYFDLDKSDIRPDARAALTKDAEFLRTYGDVRVSIEGNCDERGSTEYNLGLGQRRAQSAKSYLVSLGIAADRMETTSWGKERPVCAEHNEECWQRNRHAHLVLAH
ncbi:MAG TPA: peptidoglycan-associated lipoprotein Pal [Candidatus Acidoferrales bacterium]|nr:peptidoglycan-associated lipoprotein Pal [Candidatus Acidoferrales bacterium]